MVGWKRKEVEGEKQKTGRQEKEKQESETKARPLGRSGNWGRERPREKRGEGNRDVLDFTLDMPLIRIGEGC